MANKIQFEHLLKHKKEQRKQNKMYKLGKFAFVDLDTFEQIYKHKLKIK